MALVNNVKVLNGNLNSNAAGTTEGGTYATSGAVALGVNTQAIANLSALVGVLAETNGITVTPVWQVSNDDTTYVNATPSNDAANVVIATGTAGADTAVSACISAPDSVYGWKFARLAFKNLVQTGATGDLYSVGYCYRTLTGLETL
jgi:hypothetical protein